MPSWRSQRDIHADSATRSLLLNNESLGHVSRSFWNSSIDSKDRILSLIAPTHTFNTNANNILVAIVDKIPLDPQLYWSGTHRFHDCQSQQGQNRHSVCGKHLLAALVPRKGLETAFAANHSNQLESLLAVWLMYISRQPVARDAPLLHARPVS